MSPGDWARVSDKVVILVVELPCSGERGKDGGGRGEGGGGE